MSDDSMLRWFKYEDQKPELQAVSKPFCDLAIALCGTLGPSEERTIALRHLLDSKEAAERAYLESGAS